MPGRIEESQFRLRGYVCTQCKNTAQTFGNDPVPTACPVCGTTLPVKAAYDQLVKTVKTITDYVAPTSL